MPKNSKELFNDALSTGDHGRRDRNRNLDDTRKLDFSKVRIPLKESPVISSPLYDLVEDAAQKKPDNFLYETLSDPKLNRGIANLAGNVFDIIMGSESGNPVVDYGTANLPGVGPASILAAGGIPGLIDLAGMRGAGNAVKGLVKWSDLKEIGKLLPEVNTIADAIESSPNRDLLASLIAHGDLAGTMTGHGMFGSTKNSSEIRQYIADKLDNLRKQQNDEEISVLLNASGGELTPALKSAIVRDNLEKELRRANLDDLMEDMKTLELDVGDRRDILKKIARYDYPLTEMSTQLAADALTGVPKEVMDEYLRRNLEKYLSKMENRIPYIEEALNSIPHGYDPESRQAIKVAKEILGVDDRREFGNLDPEDVELRLGEYLEKAKQDNERMLRLIEQFGGDQKKVEKTEMQKWIDKYRIKTKQNPKDEPNPDQLDFFSLFGEESKTKPEINPEDNPLSLFYDTEKAAVKKAAEEAEDREALEKLRRFMSGEVDRVDF
jgi:hypothetical protein